MVSFIKWVKKLSSLVLKETVPIALALEYGGPVKLLDEGVSWC